MTSDQKLVVDVVDARTRAAHPAVTQAGFRWVRLQDRDEIFLRCANDTDSDVIVEVEIDGHGTGTAYLIGARKRSFIGLFEPKLMAERSIVIRNVDKTETVEQQDEDAGSVCVKWLECLEAGGAFTTKPEECDFVRKGWTKQAAGHAKETTCVRAGEDGSQFTGKGGMWSTRPFKSGRILQFDVFRYTDDFGFAIRKIPAPLKRAREEERAEARDDKKLKLQNDKKPKSERTYIDLT